MRKVLHGRRAEWETAIPAVMLSINTRVSAITSSTPASLMLGRECRKMGSLPLDGLEARAGDAALWESLRQRWEDMHEFVYPAVALSAATRAGKRNAQLDASRTIQAPHQPGTLIMARDQQRDGTLDARWAGPFTVVEQHGNSYSVKDDDGEELGRLVPHHDTKLATHVDRGDGDTFHAIENITDHSRRKGKEILYKVRWKNYGKEHDSWVAAGDVTVSAIDEYWAGVHRMTKRRGRRKHKSQATEAAPARVKRKSKATEAAPARVKRKRTTTPASSIERRRDFSPQNPVSPKDPASSPSNAGNAQGPDPDSSPTVNPDPPNLRITVSEGPRRSQRTKRAPIRLQRVVRVEEGPSAEQELEHARNQSKIAQQSNRPRPKQQRRHNRSKQQRRQRNR